MGSLHQFNPTLHQPVLKVWSSGDQYNKARGTWFYRSRHGTLHGPFMSKLTAQLDLLHQTCDAGIPMLTAFEVDGAWWWKKDTANGPAIEGPYVSETEAQFWIDTHKQALKDLASDDRYR